MAMASSGGSHAVFVYGSLLADDVVQVLLNRVPQVSPAILNGYHRFSIKGRDYPAILPVENKKVTGRVLTGLSATELDILDMYEDDKYDKRVVDVSLLDASEVLQAYAYVWGNSTDPDLYGEWDFEEFKESKLKDYLERTKNYVKELEDTETSLP
ncbi:putative gamma-glutamyl cyclotransferase [Helianthus annuus]|uniref:Putative gamma-glutamylcyclotransferase n=1 Tax=Helianthus annuus TaxID=4232 RepID=A0A251RM86_HELAN|nr:AIG2-like protein D [Helianthus annuus]KAF5754008.1 putative gamma-glutamyl cyclotransferase [Helianthus annuus]